jgi:hypothetical protein
MKDKKWYFIHVPKCAGRFVQEQLDLAIGHTHSNLKLNNLRISQQSEWSLIDSLSDPTGALKKLTFQRRGMREDFFFKNHSDTMASRYVSEVNTRNGSGLEFKENMEDKSPDDVYEPISRENSFTVIRNPFSWLTSYYLHTNSDGISGWGNANNIHGFGSFKEFVVHYCTCENHRWHSPCLNSSMAFQLFDKDNNLIPKYIIYKEKINEGLKEYFNHEVTSEKKASEFRDYDYREMYDNRLIDFVSKKFKHELKLFNYDFDGPKGDNAGFVDLRHEYDIFENKHTFLEQNVVLS